MIKDCCQNEENLVEVSRESKTNIEGQPFDHVIRQCKECGSKHHEMNVEPVKVGITGAGI